MPEGFVGINMVANALLLQTGSVGSVARHEIETHQHLQFRETSFDLAIPRQNGRFVVAQLKPYAESTRRLRRIPRYESNGLNGRWGKR